MDQGGPQEARWWLSRGPCDHPCEAGAGSLEAPFGCLHLSRTGMQTPPVGSHRFITGFCFVSFPFHAYGEELSD